MHAVTVRAANMQEVHQHIATYMQDPSKALVIFDLDLTLIVPRHPACHPHNLQRYRITLQMQWLLQRLLLRLTTLDKDKILTLGTQLHEQELIEQEAPELIASLQQQGANVIALTSSLSGGVPGLGHLVDRRYRHLSRLGIDFSQAFPPQQLEFSEFPPYNAHSPCYHRGVLYANGGNGANNKGAVLAAFLKKVAWIPQQVVMVDDLVSNLKHIERVLPTVDPSIQLLAIQYEGAQNYASQKITRSEITAYWKEIVRQVKA